MKMTPHWYSPPLKKSTRWATLKNKKAADIDDVLVEQLNNSEMGGQIPFWAGRRSLTAAWLALLLTKAGDVESNPGPTTHTNTLQSFWICDHKQTSIRSNHIHWVHLKCTQIKQRQYKPDWRCTIHTPTQNVTTTLRTAHHKQTTTHPRTNNNKPKDKNIVTSNKHKQHQKQNRGAKKNSYTAPNRASSQYK